MKRVTSVNSEGHVKEIGPRKTSNRVRRHIGTLFTRTQLIWVARLGGRDASNVCDVQGNGHETQSSRGQRHGVTWC